MLVRRIPPPRRMHEGIGVADAAHNLDFQAVAVHAAGLSLQPIAGARVSRFTWIASCSSVPPVIAGTVPSNFVPRILLLLPGQELRDRPGLQRAVAHVPSGKTPRCRPVQSKQSNMRSKRVPVSAHLSAPLCATCASVRSKSTKCRRYSRCRACISSSSPPIAGSNSNARFRGRVSHPVYPPICSTTSLKWAPAGAAAAPRCGCAARDDHARQDLDFVGDVIQASFIFAAASLPRSDRFSYVTRCPSFNPVRPAACRASCARETSFPPFSGWINPKPFVALNHFTVPTS